MPRKDTVAAQRRSRTCNCCDKGFVSTDGAHSCPACSYSKERSPRGAPCRARVQRVLCTGAQVLAAQSAGLDL